MNVRTLHVNGDRHLKIDGGDWQTSILMREGETEEDTLKRYIWDETEIRIASAKRGMRAGLALRHLQGN